MTNKINSYVADKGLLFAAVIQPMCLAIVALCAFVSICVRTRLVLAYKFCAGKHGHCFHLRIKIIFNAIVAFEWYRARRVLDMNMKCCGFLVIIITHNVWTPFEC